MAFKTLAQIELAATCAGVLAALTVAFSGGGLWSLIAQTLVSTATVTLLAWLGGGWRPSWAFDRAALGTIQSYSLNLVGFNILNYVMRNADYILIGRFLGSTSLGYYTLAYRIILYPIQNLSAVIGRVLFPALARLNDDPARFRRIYLQVMGALAVITFPLFTGLALVSDLLVGAVFGPSWQPAAALLAVLAPVGLIQAISHTVGTIYQVSGRTDLLLRWGLIAGLLTLTGFVVGLQWGVLGVASAYTFVTVALLYPVFAIPFRLIGLPVAALAATLARPALCSLCLLLAVLVVRQLLPSSLPLLALLALPVIGGALSYGLASWLLNRAQLMGLAAILRPARLQQPKEI
jgi:O-antigen/teichoic acid export membrane protein